MECCIQINRETTVQLFKLPKDMIDYLWERIDVAKKKKINLKETLAGYISCSYKLEDPQNLVIENLFNVVFNRVDNPKMFNFINEELQSNYKKVCPTQINNLVMKPRLCSLWVNFQKKGEFQPIHNHASLFSFVIWMDIPYHWKDEAKLPFARSGNKDPPGGNFAFVHSRSNSRSIEECLIQLSPSMNGYCCFFPSDLCHQVYPFYTSDKDRISISGNIVFEMEDSSEQRSQQFPFIVSNT
jgi:hypothetical protein